MTQEMPKIVEEKFANLNQRISLVENEFSELNKTIYQIHGSIKTIQWVVTIGIPILSLIIGLFGWIKM